MSNIIDKLRGGDRRSIGRSAEVTRVVLQDPSVFDDLFNGLTDEDPIVRMRAADVVEKVTIDDPGPLKSHKRDIINILENSKQQEVLWHMAQIVPRLKYTKAEEFKVVTALKGNLVHKSKIVQTFSMQALFDLAEENKDLQNEVVEIIKEKQKTGSPALQSRARQLLEKFEG